MSYQIRCPVCSQYLYFPNFDDCDEDFLQVICRGCFYKYGLIYAEIESFEISPKFRNNKRLYDHTLFSYTYTLQLFRRDFSILSVNFSIPSILEQKNFIYDTYDRVLLLYVMYGKALNNLVWIKNLTTGYSYLLFDPRTKIRAKAFAASFLILVASSLLAFHFQISSNGLFWATTLASSICSGVYVSKRASVKSSDQFEIAQLFSEQQLLAQKYEIDQKIINFSHELQENERLIQRLYLLQEKMINVGKKKYSNQVEIVAKAIAILEKQLELIPSLISDYTELSQIIEIEFETSRLTEQLPDCLSNDSINYLDKLKEIEAKRIELSTILDL